MTTADKIRRVLGPFGIWMSPPSRTGIDPEKYGPEIEAAGFTSAWFGRMDSAADLAAVEPMLSSTERLVLGTGIASVWMWAPGELAAEADRLAATYPGRFILGLGVSHAPLVESTGQDYVKPYTKMVQFLDELPPTTAPVMLAALGPKMLELSRNRTLGAHPYFTTPEHTAFAVGPRPRTAAHPRARRRARARGRGCRRGPRLRPALPAAAQLRQQPEEIRFLGRGYRRCGQRPAHVQGRAERA